MLFGKLSGVKQKILKSMDLLSALGQRGSLTLNIPATADVALSDSVSATVQAATKVEYRIEEHSMHLTFDPPVRVKYGMLAKSVRYAEMSADKVTVDLGVFTGEFDVES